MTYDGNDIAALDNVTINGTILNDTFDYDASLLQGSFRAFLSPEFDTLRSARISLNGGGGGFDVANLVGSAGVDTVTSAANAISILTPGSLAIITLGAGMEAVTVSTLAGDDSVNLSGLGAPLTSTTVYGGDGNDQLTGSPLSDLIYAGFGNDVIVGGAGADVVYGEAGNDTLDGQGGDDVLLGGDDFDIITISGATPGNDTVSGGTGGDWLLFDPTPATVISLRESAGRLRVDTGANVTLSTGISQVLFNSTGAGVTMTVHDLSGVGVDRVGVDFNGGGADSLIVEGTAGADTISVGRELTNPAGNQLDTVNLAWGRVSAGVISAAAGDRITVNGMDGNDTIIVSRSVMSAAVVPGSVGDALVTLNGGNGNDVLSVDSPAGQVGNAINGDAGDDSISGGLGDDQFDGGAGDDTFAGNGGTDNVGGGLGSSIGDAILVTGTGGSDVISLGLDANGFLLATVNGVTTTYRNFLSGPIAAAGIEGILVEGLGGNDSLTIDSTNGALPFANGVTYNGGAGSDSLTLTGGVATSDTYSVGPDVGSGSSVLVIGGVTQTVHFTGLEPVIDLVGGPLAVNATNDSNSINYTQGSVAANGLVSVDGFETIEFSNKTTLTINALSGDDTINVNNPTTPTGLTSVTVNGGDPTGSDTLIVNSTAGFSPMVVRPTAQGVGTVDYFFAGNPDVPYTGIEHVTLVGQLADGDAFGVDGTAGADEFQYYTGATPDIGTVLGTMNDGAFTLPEITFSQMSQASTLVFNTFGAQGGADTFVFNGSAANDVINYDGAGQLTNLIGGQLYSEILIGTAGGGSTTALRIEGLDGDDAITVTPQIGVSIAVNAGDPSASDTLNYNGAGAGLITEDLSTSTITKVGFGAVTYTGVEHLNIDGGNAAGVVIQGLAAVDQFAVTPTGNASALISDAGVNTAIAVNNVTALTVNGNDGVVPTNVLIVEGSQAADIIAVDDNSVDITGMLSVQYVDIQSVIVKGLAGSDTFNVTPAGAPPISIVGGDPAATSPGDVLNVTSAAAVTLSAGPEADSGSVAAGTDVVTFDEIETLSVTLTGAGAAGAVVINATNGDDDITVIGTGTNDFTVSINNGPAVQFTDATSLTVNALSGDDDVVLDPAGVLTIPVAVNGGQPGAGSDTFIVNGTAGADAVTITSLTLDSATVTGLGPVVNVSSTEHLIYNGAGGADTMNLVTPAGNTIVYFTPGADANEGGVNLRQANGGDLLGFSYVNVDGFNGVLNLNSAADSVNINGTGDNDLFTVTAGGAVRIATPGTLGTPYKSVTINTAGAGRLDLLGGNGDDTFNVPGNHAYAVGLFVQGGDPSASDILNVDGDNVAAALTVSLTASSVTQAGSTAVTYTGIETLNIAGGANAITVNGVAGQDTISVTPTGANTARLNVAGSNTVINTTNTAALTLNPGTGVDAISVIGSGDDDVITVTRGATTTVQVTTQNPFAVALKTISITSAFTQTLVVEAGLGDDVINVTGAGGPGTLIVHGDEPSASDTLNIDTGTDATVNFGADPTSGVVTATSGNVSFTGIEALGLTGDAAGTLTINGSNGNDAINQNGNTVTVNAGTTVDFADYPTLTLNGANGDDTFNVHPTTLAGVTTINLNGGDPTASDELIVNGTAGNDTIGYNPSDTIGSGSVTVNAAPVVNFTTIESVVVDGQGGTDALTHTTAASVHQVTYTPGAASDAGTIATRSTGGGAPGLVPLAFSHIGANGSVTFASAGGREDVLELNGTNNSDIFNVNQTADQIQIISPTSAFVTVDLNTGGIAVVDLRGLDGDDTFNLAATLPYFAGVLVDGGNPSASDTLNLSGAAGAIVEDLAAQTVTGYGATVSFLGVEHVNLAGTGGAATLTINATTGNDQLAYTPTGASAGTVTRTGQNVETNFTGIAGTFTLDGIAGTDVVTVNGTSVGDTVAVDRTASTVQVNALKTVTISSEAIVVAAGLGSDVINVTGTSASSLTVDGGQPTASGDALNVTASNVTVTYGTDPATGTVNDVSFLGIETIGLTGDAAGTLTINGTNGNDAINQNGNTVTVNNGATVTFAAYPTLTLNGNNGDDTFNVHPTTLAGVATFNVNGGDPTASDTVIVNGTVAANNVTITSLTADSATVTGLGPVMNVAGTEHLTYNGQGGADNMNLVTPVGNTVVYFTPGADANEGGVNLRQAFGGDLLGFNYVSVDGFNGVLNLTSAGDSVNVNGTGDNDLFTVTAGGAVRIATPGTLGTPFKSVTMNTAGAARLDLLGGNGDDTFNVPGNHAYAVGLFVQGGDPSASDILNVDGDNVAAALTVSLTASSVTQAGSAAVTYSGIETLNITGGANAITVNGVAGQDTISVTPTGANSARLEVDGSNTVINTTNTAALTLNPGTGVDVIAVHGSGDDDVIAVTRGGTTTVQVTTQNPAAVALKTISITSAFTQTLVIEAGLGDDVINVTGAGGPGTLIVHGDEPSASDTLNIDTGTNATVNFGADSTSGVVAATSGNVSFTGIEDLGLTGDAAGTLTINGSNGNDAINQNGNTVTVNAGTTVDFADYATLTLNGANGDDTFNVNPTTLAGVTTFNVNGGDPTASDTVIVNGTTGNDTIVYSPNSLDSGTVTVNGVATNFSGTEHLTVNGLSNFTGDSLTVNTESIDGTQVLTPGSTFDSGSVDFLTGGFATNQAVPLKFVNLGVNGSLTFDDFLGTRFDNLIYNGTAGDDTFSVDAAGVVLLNSQIPVNTPSIITLTLRGLDGDDTFNVAGNHNLSSIAVEGGNPSASDVLNFIGAGGTIAVNLGAATITETGFGLVGYTGIEIANVDASGGDLDLTGTSGADVLSVTPTDTDAATATLLSSNPNIGSTPVINGSAIGTLSVDLAGAADRLVVNATQAGETITADGALVTVGAFETVNYTNTEDLHLVGLAGSDTFNVTPALNTTIFVDGGDPIGSTPGDQLNLFPPAAFVLEAGPETDEGGLRGLLMQRVSWDHIEGISIAGPGPAKVVGTNGDDDITVIARDSSTHAGADGVRDFTVSINGGIAVLFLDQATLLIDALAGDDDIVVRAPAPNSAVWNVQLTVAGGTPAAATGDQGDVLEYETPGQQTITYTPGAIPGTGVINDLTLASSITIAQFLCPVDMLPSSAGSIEQLILDGEGGNDSVTVFGTAAADSFVQTPGSLVDSGSIAINNQLGVTYEDLGAGATLAIDGLGASDTVTVDGTANSDVFGVLANGNVTLAGHLTLTRTNYENLILRGQNGDDTYNVNGGTSLTSIVVEGSDPSASDVLNYTATANAGTNVDLGASTITQSGPAGVTVVLSGIELVNLTSSGGASTLNVTGTSGDDTINVSPTAAGAGSFVRLGLGGAPQFTYTGVGGAFTVAGGSGGFDTLGILGNDAADTVTSTATTVTIKGGTVTLGAGLDYLNISTFGGDDNITLTGLAIAKTIDAGAGNDFVDLSAAVDATIFGGLGDDILIGSPVADLIYGGSGNDILIGGGGIDHEYGEDGNDQFGDLSLAGNGVANDAGSDFLFGGDGADTFVWEPGDGSDAIQGGNDEGDSLRFLGNGVANTFVLSDSTSNPSHFNMNFGLANVDTSGVEQVFLGAQGGADIVTVLDLTTTEIKAVNIDLGAGDADSVTVNGRTTADNLAVTVAAGVISLQGLGYDVNISSATAPADTLTINGNAGNDTIKVNANVETTIGIVLNGNDGDDFLSGGGVINGGNGNDTIEGGAGPDFLNGDDGDDTFIFNAGTGVDTINGGNGGDTFLIATNIQSNVISVSETAVTVDGLTENLATSNVELFHVLSNAGNDTITVGLTAVAGLIEAGAGNDSVNGSGASSTLTIFGEDGNDTLIGSSGDDLIFGGSGNDIIIGGAGVDHEYGEDGNDRFGDLSLSGNGVADDAGADLVFGGAGADVFIWELGDGSDSVEGGDDEGDVLRFLGSAAANAFLLSANSVDPTHFNATLGLATVDTAGVEQVILSALGGADSVTVNDLATTEIKAVNIDLGLGDADTVTYNGRNIADDVAISSPVAGSVTFQGLGYDLNILNATTADTLTVNGNEGNDTIKANTGVENTIGIVLNGNDGNDYLSADATLNGGNGNDILVGGVGVDTINGDAGDDILTGNGAADFLNGGTGTDTVLEYRDANFTLSNTALTIGAEGTDTLTSIERANLSGGLSSNNFDIGAFSGTTTIFGDEGSDTLDFHAQTTVLKIDLDLVDEAQVVSPTGRKLILVDAIENVIATVNNDLIYVDIALFDRFVDGGAETSIPAGDRLHVDMLQSNPNSTKIPNGKPGSYDGTVNGSFYTGTVNYVDIETLVIDNPNGGGGNNNGDIPIDFGAATDYTISNDPHSVAAEDVNGDGILDMIVASKMAGTVSVRFGNGFGGFGSEAVYNSGNVKKERSITVALGDVDNDGDLDIVVTNRRDNSVGVLRNNGAGVFSGPTTFSTGVGKLGKFPMSVKLGDMNNDGNIDIVTTNASRGKKTSSIAILLGNGTGSFGTANTTPVQGRKARDLVLGDFNQDGNLDLVATNLLSREVVFMAGNGAGGLAAPVSYTVGSQPTSIIAADFNGDGLLDLAVTCQVVREISVLMGTGLPVGTFGETIGIKYPNLELEISINSADLNGDGNSDLIVANRVTNTLSYMLGLGNGTFDTRVDFKVGGVHGRQPVAIAYGDFNNDGAIDLMVANAGTDDVSVLLRNPLV